MRTGLWAEPWKTWSRLLDVETAAGNKAEKKHKKKVWKGMKQ